jgi:aminopeptidase N
MRPETPATIHLKDYTPPPYVIKHVDFDVRLHETQTSVLSRIQIFVRHVGQPLTLHGEDLTLTALRIDGILLTSEAYALSNECLTIHNPPAVNFAVEIEQHCNPKANTKLSGLYLSNGMFCTQMEAEGFRRFAYFYDRPDVMATYRVRVEADKSLPVLLSNGNPLESGDVPGTDNHFAIWDDPHPKPTYLFALVGGDLASVHDTFKTMTGQDIRLGIYVEKGKVDRCAWAMESLKASMHWDEQRFGRVYDLDVFNIVAVSDFNMGAMENKGLNIFNDKYVLALPTTATDTDYASIEAIIAHEYFHNWTGNRITCRDWFQLCLKEGLTVFRDQEFTSDLRSRAVKRITDVKTLRARQIPEDQGPLAHPVRPTSYIEINNFYTATVYEKGAELCRMLLTLIGDTAFRAAMDLYFERHDGQAATVEDFVCCMADASGRDLTQFFRWYEQSGTPAVNVRGAYDEMAQRFTIDVSQSNATSPGQAGKLPLHIPLALGLLGKDGRELLPGRQVLEMTDTNQSWTFEGIAEKPVMSFNRGYTAPIALMHDLNAQDLLFLMGHDSDSFNRWDSAQMLGRGLIAKTVDALKHAKPVPSAGGFADALQRSLRSNDLDDAFKALIITLPPEAEIAASIGGNADSALVHQARETVRRNIANHIGDDLTDTFNRCADDRPYHPDTASAALRSLRFAALGLIAAGDADQAFTLAEHELDNPSNMTAEIGSLSAILAIDDPRRDAMLAQFYDRHRDDHLLIDKWFLLNAQIPGEDAHQRIEKLLVHPDFRLTTPNRVYALLGGFTAGCLSGFNAGHGEGYRVAADVIIALDAINPQAASRMATGFRSWSIFDTKRRDHARREMTRILHTQGLSRDVFEIISRTLA